jgi:LacI family transcriptional regulator, galactose operon repressor
MSMAAIGASAMVWMGCWMTRVRGLRIPGEMAVVGFDNPVVIADRMPPGLSTVALPYHEMGSRAVKVLLDPQLSATAASQVLSPMTICISS